MLQSLGYCPYVFSVHVLPVCVLASSGLSGFLLPPRNMPVGGTDRMCVHGVLQWSDIPVWVWLHHQTDQYKAAAEDE